MNNNNIKKYTIYAPKFAGFYNTEYDCESDEENFIYNIKENLVENYNIKLTSEELELEDWDLYDKYFELDFEGYMNDMGSLFIDFLNDYNFSDIGIEKDFEFKNISSPKYYNYSNDNINIDVSININKLIEFVRKEGKKFKDYIKNQNTSYDGFIAFLPNDLDEYIEYIKNNDHIEAIITQILNYYIDEYIEFNDGLYLEFYNNYNLYECFYNNIKFIG